MIIDVPAPGQRLVADTDAAFGGTLAQLVKIPCRPVDAAKRGGRDVRADQHQISAQFAHQVELALGPVKHLAALRLRHPLEIAERLEQRDLEPVIAHHPANIPGAAVIGQKVILEDLDTVESGIGNGRELLAQVTGNRDCGDGGLHPGYPKRRGSHSTIPGNRIKAASARMSTPRKAQISPMISRSGICVTALMTNSRMP